MRTRLPERVQVERLSVMLAQPRAYAKVASITLAAPRLGTESHPRAAEIDNGGVSWRFPPAERDRAHGRPLRVVELRLLRALRGPRMKAKRSPGPTPTQVPAAQPHIRPAPR